MKKHIIEITYPEDKMIENRRRLEAVEKFEYTDRVPVVTGVYTRFPLKARNVALAEYDSDPQTQLYHQLLNTKWNIENIPDDRCISTQIAVGPDFHNMNTAGGFGAQIDWLEDSPPRIHPLIESPPDIDKLPVPQPTDNLWGKKVEWFHKMKELLKDIKVIFNGKPAPVDVTVGGFEGVLTAAVDLVGSRFYQWLYEYPRACHKLLSKITTGQIRWEAYCRELMKAPGTGFGSAEDAAQMISLSHFREFVVPYHRELYQTFPGDRGMHMCGTSSHLLQSLVDDLRISHFNGFGREVDPRYIAKIMGGKVKMSGNIDPMLIQTGPKEKIIEASLHCLDAIAPYGGFILADGHNVPPGAPLENIRALVEAAQIYGKPEKLVKG